MTLAGHHSAHGGRPVNQKPPLIRAAINQGSISQTLIINQIAISVIEKSIRDKCFNQLD